MATSFRISVDLKTDLRLLGRAGGFPALSTAVESVARAGVERWQRAVLGSPELRDAERRAYADTITYQMTGPYAAVVVSDYKYVEDIETGRPPFDLKRMLDTSLKVRVNKKGQRYLIIPMRHNTPGNTASAPAMPAAIYAEARQLSPSRVVGGGMRPSGTGAYSMQTRRPIMVRKLRYQWGDRLPAMLAPKIKPEHHSDPYAGMVRFKAGGGSTYMTFRVMGEWQTGKWIIPAKPGLFLAKAVADSMQRTADQMFPDAVRQDLGA